MEQIRKPFQGVLNIIRFNWHLYLIATIVVIVITVAGKFLTDPFALVAGIAVWSITITTIFSLIISLYIYDFSELYKLSWLDKLNIKPNTKIVNIHAGFDESSRLLVQKFGESDLIVYDFYDPLLHTEISIKRARKLFPDFKGTRQITTSNLPLKNNFADVIMLMFSAHEIRNEKERITFFEELNRIIKYSGKVILIEHLRDALNFLSYNIGFFHFFSRASWQKLFLISNFRVCNEIKITPFVTVFVLEKNGS